MAALRSSRGASFQILKLLGDKRFELAVSVPLVLEYEDALARLEDCSVLAPGDARVVVDYICSIAHRQSIFYLWRPWLTDPKDDMVLELAIAAGVEMIVTHNVRDFERAMRLGVRPVRPAELLQLIRRSR